MTLRNRSWLPIVAVVAIAGLTNALAAQEAVPTDGDPATRTLEVLEHHFEARGGREAWGRVTALRAEGSYSAFSQRSDFTLLRAEETRYRLDFQLLEAPAIRARDEQGVWWQHKLLQPQPGRIEEGPYRTQLERESWFGPGLLSAHSQGLAIEWVGPSEVDGIATVELRLRLDEDREERWHLDAETGLEVAVDSRVQDFTQSGEPVEQRIFFDDFRTVGELVVPHQIDWEFGHRLESLSIDRLEIDPEFDSAAFSPPPADPVEDDSGDGR